MILEKYPADAAAYAKSPRTGHKKDHFGDANKMVNICLNDIARMVIA